MLQRVHAEAEQEARRWTRMLIDGGWVDAASGDRIVTLNPATGSEIGDVPAGGAVEVDAAVAAARCAFEDGRWTGLAASKRASILFRVADMIEARVEAIASVETLDAGMPIGMARSLSMLGAETFRYFAGWCTKLHGETAEISGAHGQFHSYTRREPIGVVALITPWNAPFLFACNKVAVALAAGCTVVLKPSEETSLTSLILGAILAEAGVPPGVCNVVTGRGSDAGNALAEHPQVDKISFTGSTQVGRRLIHAAADSNLKRLSLELGGKSPVLVFDDADIDLAVPTILRGIFTNAGQVCMAGSRLYVQRSAYHRLMEAIATRANAMRMGDGFAADTDIGPLISRQQRDRVQALVESGMAEGATLLAGGRIGEGQGNFMQATILSEPHPDARVLREEIFGPVLVAQPFDELDEAVMLANDTEYGLAAAVWTRDIGRAHRIARQVRAGTVWLNCELVTDRALPFGGYKSSGWGRENAREGIDAFLQTKTVIAAI